MGTATRLYRIEEAQTLALLLQCGGIPCEAHCDSGRGWWLTIQATGEEVTTFERVAYLIARPHRETVERLDPIAREADRVARLISFTGRDDHLVPRFTEADDAECVEAIRALWEALEEY